LEIYWACIELRRAHFGYKSQTVLDQIFINTTICMNFLCNFKVKSWVVTTSDTTSMWQQVTLFPFEKQWPLTFNQAILTIKCNRVYEHKSFSWWLVGRIPRSCLCYLASFIFAYLNYSRSLPSMCWQLNREWEGGHNTQMKATAKKWNVPCRRHDITWPLT